MWGLFIFSMLSQWMIVAGVTTVAYVTVPSESPWPAALAFALCMLFEFVCMIVLYVIHEKTRKDEPSGFGSDWGPGFGSDCGPGVGCIILPSGPQCSGDDCVWLAVLFLIVGILFSSVANAFLLVKIYENVTQEEI